MIPIRKALEYGSLLKDYASICAQDTAGKIAEVFTEKCDPNLELMYDPYEKIFIVEGSQRVSIENLKKLFKQKKYDRWESEIQDKTNSEDKQLVRQWMIPHTENSAASTSIPHSPARSVELLRIFKSLRDERLTTPKGREAFLNKLYCVLHLKKSPASIPNSSARSKELSRIFKSLRDERLTTPEGRDVFLRRLFCILHLKSMNCDLSDGCVSLLIEILQPPPLLSSNCINASSPALIYTENSGTSTSTILDSASNKRKRKSTEERDHLETIINKLKTSSGVQPISKEGHLETLIEGLKTSLSKKNLLIETIKQKLMALPAGKMPPEMILFIKEMVMKNGYGGTRIAREFKKIFGREFPTWAIHNRIYTLEKNGKVPYRKRRIYTKNI